jgi:hypothetical protein
MSIPVVVYQHAKDLVVTLELELLEIRQQSTTRQMSETSIGKRKYDLTQQSDTIGWGQYKYVRILTAKDLPKAGTYTGLITVAKTKTPETNPALNYEPILSFPVTITLNSSILDEPSRYFKAGSQSEYKTMREIFNNIYAGQRLYPNTIKTNPDGTFCVNYDITDSATHILQYRGDDDGYLPEGSSITILDKMSGCPIPGHLKMPLLRTDRYGRDIHTNVQITQDQKLCSFYPVHVDTGEYLYFVEYVTMSGLHKTSEYKSLKIT